MSGNKPKYIIIHCSDSIFGNEKLIDEWHKERGFSKIGYHYVICNGRPKSKQKDNSDGKIEIGRNEDEVGAHCTGVNTQSIGICLIGVNKFTEAQFVSLKSLVNKLRAKYVIPFTSILGHNQTASGMQQGKTCPNFDVHDWVNSELMNIGTKFIINKLEK